MEIQYIFKDGWETSNNVVSLAMAIASLKRGFILLEGDLIFSDLNINENVISGTFNFKSNELVDFQNIVVTEGIFTNLNY